MDSAANHVHFGSAANPGILANPMALPAVGHAAVFRGMTKTRRLRSFRWVIYPDRLMGNMAKLYASSV